MLVGRTSGKGVRIEKADYWVSLLKDCGGMMVFCSWDRGQA